MWLARGTRLRICSSGKSGSRPCTAVEETDVVEAKILLAECRLQARDFRREKGAQVPSLAPYSQTHLAVAHHGVYFDIAKSLSLQPQVHFRLRHAGNQTGSFYGSDRGQGSGGIRRGGLGFRCCRRRRIPASRILSCGERNLRQNVCGCYGTARVARGRLPGRRSGSRSGRCRVRIRVCQA